jgi:hypothetical protein
MKLQINKRDKNYNQISKDISSWVNLSFKTSWKRNGKTVTKKSFTPAQKRELTNNYKTLFGWEKTTKGEKTSGDGLIQGQFIKHRPRSEKVRKALTKKLHLPANFKSFPIQSPPNRKIKVKLDKKGNIIIKDDKGIIKTFIPFDFYELVTNREMELERIFDQYPDNQRYAFQTGQHTTLTTMGAMPKSKIKSTLNKWFQNYKLDQMEKWMLGLIAMDFKSTGKKITKYQKDLKSATIKRIKADQAAKRKSKRKGKKK